MDLSFSARTLLRYSWLIALFIILPAVMTFLVSNSLPRSYESSARVLVGSLTSADLQQQLGYQQLARAYAGLVETPVVLEQVAETIGRPGDSATLAEDVVATVPPDSSVVLITTSGRTPEGAANLAAAVSQRIVELSTPPASPPPAIVPVSLAAIIQPAAPEPEPAAPRVLFNTGVAAFVGLGLGVLVAMLIGARYDARRKETEQVQLADSLGFPIGPYTR